MNLGKITVITPPDKLFNMAFSYLLVKPSLTVKQQFQTILSHSIDDINVFIFDDDEFDISWLLSIALQVDLVIIDVDNCDPTTRAFVSLMLSQPNAHYLTNSDDIPYKLISKNRIYDLNQIIEQIKQETGEDDDASEE